MQSLEGNGPHAAFRRRIGVGHRDQLPPFFAQARDDGHERLLRTRLITAYGLITAFGEGGIRNQDAIAKTVLLDDDVIPLRVRVHDRTPSIGGKSESSTLSKGDSAPLRWIPARPGSQPGCEDL